MGTSAGGHGTSGDRGDHRRIAALALGLAYSELDDRFAVTELTRSGDAEALTRASQHLSTLAAHDPELARALGLIDAALARLGADGSP